MSQEEAKLSIFTDGGLPADLGFTLSDALHALT